MLANKLGAAYTCRTKIILYVMAWDGMVTKLHKRYANDFGITESVEAYIQAIVLKKTLESISYEYRRSGSDVADELRAPSGSTASKADDTAKHDASATTIQV